MIYTLTLNPALDYTLVCDKIELGKTNRSKFEELSYGGKGINVSYVLNQLSCNNIALGFYAGFVGNELIKKINDISINNDFIKCKSGNTRINIKLKSDEETEINATGPQIRKLELETLFYKLSRLTEKDLLIMSGSIPKGLPNDIYAVIAKLVTSNKARFIADISGNSLLGVLKYKPLLVKPNKQEIIEIFGNSIKSENDFLNCGEKLQLFGAENVLISLGKDGALLLDKNGRVLKSQSIGGKAVNTVGAGDSMVAGFSAGLKVSTEYAFKLALACGGATAISNGLANKETIYKLLELTK